MGQEGLHRHHDLARVIEDGPGLLPVRHHHSLDTHHAAPRDDRPQSGRGEQEYEPPVTVIACSTRLGDHLAQLTMLAALSRRLSAAVATRRRAGVSPTDLDAHQADLVTRLWEVGAPSFAWSPGSRLMHSWRPAMPGVGSELLTGQQHRRSGRPASGAGLVRLHSGYPSRSRRPSQGGPGSR